MLSGRRCGWVLIAALAWVGASASGARAIEITAVALSGDTAPDLDPFVPITEFSQFLPLANVRTAPVVDQDGRVIFLSGFPPSGIWAGDGSNGRTLEKLVASFDPAPGFGPSHLVQSILGAWSGGGGYAVLDVSVAPLAQLPVQVLYSAGPGGTVIIAEDGQNAPGTTGVFTLAAFAPAPQVGSAGEYAFAADLERTGDVTSANDTGIWAGSGGPPSLLLREGDPAPGFDADCVPTPDGTGSDPDVRVAFVQSALAGVPALALSRDGTLAMHARIEGCPPPGTADVVWLREPGAIARVVAMTNDTLGGGQLLSPDYVSLSDAGALGITGDGFVNGRLGVSVWTLTDAGDEVVGFPGLFVPGMPPGSTVQTIAWPPSVADTGRAAFEATFLENAPADRNSGLFARGGGRPAFALAMEGSAAPGAQDGAVFADVTDLFDSSVFESDGEGNVAFSMRLAQGPGGGVVDSTNDLGLWRSGPNGPVELIARTGDTLTVAEGDERIVDGLVFAGDGGTIAGHGGGMGPDGEVAFWASFTDGSEGIFVTDPAPPVPEPGAILAQLAALATLYGVARRRGA